MLPVASEGCLSVSGVHFFPASDVFHTPPSAAPRYTVEESSGSTTSAVTRPEKGPLPHNEQSRGRGPTSCHLSVAAGLFADIFAHMESSWRSEFRYAPLGIVLRGKARCS